MKNQINNHKPNKFIKIAIVASYPAAKILPEKYIKSRTLRIGKIPHQAPWVRSLSRELILHKNVKLRIFSHCPDIYKIYHAEKDGISYTFIPKYEPRRLDPYHFFIPAVLQLSPHIRKFNPDIVHGFGMENAYGLVAVSQKKPSVVFIQGIQEKLAPYYDMHSSKVTIRKFFEKLVVRKADALIAETDFGRRWAKRVRPDVRVKVIPHAYTSFFLSNRPRFQQKKIVCIGSLSRTKGCTKVLEAFYSGVIRNPTLFKSSVLEFVGGGPMRAELKNQVAEYGIAEYVNILGRAIHEEIPKKMEQACMLVIGSRMDTSPNVITEAHASGIPVIGTATGGIPDMIEDKRDGFVVPVDDADTMSHRMEILLNDMELCAAMGRNGREKVKYLNNPTRIADEHISFYNEILSGCI